MNHKDSAFSTHPSSHSRATSASFAVFRSALFEPACPLVVGIFVHVRVLDKQLDKKGEIW